MNARRRLAGEIDARLHMAHLVGETVRGVLDGQPYRVLGVSHDHVYVSAADSPLGKSIPVADVQAAFDRLVSGEQVPLSGPSLGKHSSFLAAAMMSVPGAGLLHGPIRVGLVDAAHRP